MNKHVADLESAPRKYQQYIAGKWSDAEGERTFEDFDPFNGEIVALIPAAGKSDAQRAIAAAADAFPAWAAMQPAAKQRLFLRAADIVERRTPELISLLARESGACGTYAGFQIQWAISLLRQVSNWGYLPVGDVLRSDGPGKFVMAVRKPLGVVAGITPWNGAFNLAWRTALLPMAFGNTMVLKPSEESPVTAGLVLAEILDEAEFPPGVFNVITHAPGDAGPIADAIFESPAVRSINFTGSSSTGRMLAERAGRALKRIVLELGGYNPLIILRDADLAQAVDTTAFGAFFHQGQICMNTRKAFVERPIADEFLARLIAKTESLKAGDPKIAGTIIGPLINDRALQMVKQRVEEAVSKGARILVGGRHEGPVYYPTILMDVSPDSTASKEETFGPVLIVEPVDNAEEALARATATRYGLCAAILTGDQEKGLALAERIDAGMVHVNGPTWQANHRYRTAA